MKKITACVLSILMILSCFSVFATAQTENSVPIVYLKGAGEDITAQKQNYDSEHYYPIQIPDGYIGEKCKELAVPLGYGLLSGDYKEYGDGLYDAIMPFLEKLACNKDGTVTDGSGNAFSPTSSPSFAAAGSGLKAYFYSYDWRLDPSEIAVGLNDYINTVKRKTGVQRVNVVARCLGANIMLAYFDKYGAKSINECILYCTGFDGLESIEAIFTGSVKLDDDSVDRFLNNYLSIGDYSGDENTDYIKYLVTCLDYIKMLGFTTDSLQSAINGIKNGALKKILRESFATMPAFWSYIGDESYAKAKKYIFGGVEDEYAALIEKIDAYHNILVNYEAVLDEAEQDGAKFYNVCKYGMQMIPVTGSDNRMSDDIVTTANSSMGATCSTLTGKLSVVHLAQADERFVSADNQIDATTCKYPEHTWFVKNIAHRNTPYWFNNLFKAIFDYDGYTTVFDMEEYPQYLVSSDDGSTVSPLTAQNGNTVKKMTVDPLNAVVILLIKVIFKLIDVVGKYIAESVNA